MRAFLSGSVARHRNPGREFVDRERGRFAGVCRDVRGALGSRPFNERGQLRMPLLDSALAAFARSAGRTPEDMGDRFERLLAGEEFAGPAVASSSSAAARGRLRLAQEILFGLVGRAGGARQGPGPGCGAQRAASRPPGFS